MAGKTSLMLSSATTALTILVVVMGMMSIAPTGATDSSDVRVEKESRIVDNGADNEWVSAKILECGLEIEGLGGFDLIGLSTTGEEPESFQTEEKILTLEVEQYQCIFGQTLHHSDVKNLLLEPKDPVWDHPSELGTFTHTAGDPPFTGWDSGKFEMHTLIPQYPIFTHPNCNFVWSAMVSALDALGDVVGGTQDLFCYEDYNWDTNGESDGITLIEGQMHDRIDALYGSNWPEFHNRNEAIAGWFGELNVCGVAESPGRLSANYAYQCGDFDLDGLFMHEFSHNFDAIHYPDEFWKTSCVGEHSVMNYCWLEAGYMVYDSDNEDVINDNYWAFS